MHEFIAHIVSGLFCIYHLHSTLMHHVCPAQVHALAPLVDIIDANAASVWWLTPPADLRSGLQLFSCVLINLSDRLIAWPDMAGCALHSEKKKKSFHW